MHTVLRMSVLSSWMPRVSIMWTMVHMTLMLTIVSMMTTSTSHHPLLVSGRDSVHLHQTAVLFQVFLLDMLVMFVPLQRGPSVHILIPRHRDKVTVHEFLLSMLTVLEKGRISHLILWSVIPILLSVIVIHLCITLRIIVRRQLTILAGRRTKFCGVHTQWR